jgi:hypothetical protein
MRPGYSIFILSLIMLAVIMAGCTDNNKQGNATPTIAPNVTATPTVLPDIKGTIHSSQIRLVDLKIINAGSNEGRPGDYNITLENVGNVEACNVNVNLVVTDMKTLEQLYDINYTLDRPIPAHGNSNFTMAAGLYGPHTDSVILGLRLYWGDRQEFWSAYNTTRALPWIQQVGST